MELFDTHAHYNDERFNDDMNEIITRNYANGIKFTTCVGYSLDSSKKAIEIANNYNYIYSTVRNITK